ncbi:conserved hypothetical protein [Ricinus communis]|uniref:Uncharacterized protein n=1 Tax=Ricinus communis TaxID=3988 RepID=B9SS81_RICCO|nr:conserved hypothetical protein [Ricinus communis]
MNGNHSLSIHQLDMLFLMIFFMVMPAMIGGSAIALAGATLLYGVGKDAYVSVQRKASYSKNLKENYESLQWELNFLLGFRTDMERAIRRRRRNYREMYNKWNSQVEQIEERVRNCLGKYEHIRNCSIFRRSKLSKRMVKLYKKVVEVKGEGKDLSRLLSI